jgi:glycosyltransferase involved in cell wall biosynthesis
VAELAVIVPTFNEATALPATLAAIERARSHLRATCGWDSELIVVDNASTDGTADVAAAAGAAIVTEPVRSIARARNAGARAANREVLVFVDADTWIPPNALERIAQAMAAPGCIGGALDVVHTPRRRLLQLYLAGWRTLGTAFGMCQGATQFCRRSVFEALGGYDEHQWMGEDVEFQWRLRRLARRTGGTYRVIHDCRVVPSPRRFDNWPLWRTLAWTNPLVTAAFARSSRVWRKGWYEQPPR